MCGIVGFVTSTPLAPAVARQRLERMVTALAHRGPDDSGTFADGRVGLGHARLSIIDLSPLGHQPMANEDASIQVVFNGEIYNFQSLRAELCAAGHTFASHTDTEVLLHGYEQWGFDRLVDRLEGMFAFALYDAPRQQLLLARDPFGIKPLYYTGADGEFRFASELKAVLADAEKTPALAGDALLLSFQHVGIPAPKTICDGYLQLPPATTLRYDIGTGESSVRQYWDWSVAPEIGDAAEAARVLWDCICRSVEKHLIADVPVGLFLSGGLDSSLVAAACAEIGRKPTCLTIALDDPEHDESAAATALCRHYGLPHRIETMAADKGRDYDGRLAGMFDEPFAASAALSTAYVTEIAARDFKVMLSGEGGDELFGGYNWYRDWTAFYGVDGIAPPSWRVPRNTMRRWLGRRNMPVDPMAGYARLMAAFTAREMRALFAPELLARFPEAADAGGVYRRLDRPDFTGFDRLQYLDLHLFLPSVCLTKMDRCSMAVSLEVRVPFLDRTVAQLVGRIDAAVRNPQQVLKGLLRHIAREKLPDMLLDKPKQGFSTPIRQWFPKSVLLASMQEDRARDDWWRGIFAADALHAVSRYRGRSLWRFWHTWRWVRDQARMTTK